MNEHTALFALAFAGRSIRFVCEDCGRVQPQPVAALADRFGPLTPLALLTTGSHCGKCGSVHLRAETA
jgi:uncharacterized OB-fold protein